MNPASTGIVAYNVIMPAPVTQFTQTSEEPTEEFQSDNKAASSSNVIGRSISEQHLNKPKATVRLNILLYLQLLKRVYDLVKQVLQM